MCKPVVVLSCLVCLCHGRWVEEPSRMSQIETPSLELLTQLLLQHPGIVPSRVSRATGNLQTNVPQMFFGGGGDENVGELVVEFKDRDDTNGEVKRGKGGSYEFWNNGRLMLVNAKVERGAALGRGAGTLLFSDGQGAEALVTNLEESEIDKVMMAGLPTYSAEAALGATSTVDWTALTLGFSAILLLILAVSILPQYAR